MKGQCPFSLVSLWDCLYHSFLPSFRSPSLIPLLAVSYLLLPPPTPPSCPLTDLPPDWSVIIIIPIIRCKNLFFLNKQQHMAETIQIKTAQSEGESLWWKEALTRPQTKSSMSVETVLQILEGKGGHRNDKRQREAWRQWDRDVNSWTCRLIAGQIVIAILMKLLILDHT